MLVVRQTMSLRDFPRMSADVYMGDLPQATHIWSDIAEYCGPDKLLDLVDLRG